MELTFTEEQAEIRKTIISFAQRELNIDVAERDKAGVFPRGLWNRCAEMRILASLFPEPYGGDGFDFTTTVSIFHALGYACKDSGLVHSLITQVMCGILIHLFASRDQAARLLPDIASGRLIYAQAITEPGSGSDALAMRTTAVKKGDGYLLNGSKTMISNGPIADRVLVFAATDPTKKALGGFSCFLVSTGDAGFSQGKPIEKMGLRTLMNGELFLSDCYVPADALIGREGQGAILFNEVMEWERTLIPACLLGELERVLEETVQYAQEREAFDRPIGNFQAVSHKIANMKMNVELGKLALYHAAALKGSRKHAALETSVAKLFISESLKQACLDAVQIHGGYGYMTEYEVERELRDSIASTIYSGTSEIQANIIARLAGLKPHATTKLS
ncbi:MAG: acyl-CoA dehydrogenase family protein [Anaerolineales bacterium]|nr:acyl-CoA dehydrogenase family protein [Anaerolineales bacterium]